MLPDAATSDAEVTRVITVSDDVDGQGDSSRSVISFESGIPGFPDARRDNGIATTLKVSQVPAVYLAQPFTGKITPIGFGVLSEAQLLERIALVSTPQADAMLPSASSQIGHQSLFP